MEKRAFCVTEYHLLTKYVTLEHKTSHKGTFFEIEFMHHLKAE